MYSPQREVKGAERPDLIDEAVAPYGSKERGRIEVEGAETASPIRASEPSNSRLQGPFPSRTSFCAVAQIGTRASGLWKRPLLGLFRGLIGGLHVTGKSAALQERAHPSD
jgi:hypothetical protein